MESNGTEKAKNNGTWLRVFLTFVSIAAIGSVAFFGFTARKAIANAERIAVLETRYDYIQNQLDRIETKQDITIAKVDSLAREIK
jgi:hypothetical protein